MFRSFFSWIPNALTLTNLLFGMLAIRFILRDNLADGSICIMISLLADFFDGMAARALKVEGPLGVQLDSLADVVTFGVAPSLMMYMLASPYHANYNGWQWGDPMYLQILALGIGLASAWRLAKFNIDTDQREHFIGLPTPANACLPASLPFIIQQADPYWGLKFTQPYALLLIILLCIWLPVSQIYFMKLKWKGFNTKTARNQWIWLGLGIILFAFLGALSVPLILLLYYIFSYFEQKSFQPQTDEI